MDSVKLVQCGVKDWTQDREAGLAAEVNNLIQLLRNPTLKGFVYAVEVDDPENPVELGRIATGFIGTTNCIALMLDALGQSAEQMLNEDSARRDSNEQRNDDESDDQESEKDWDDPTQF